MAKQADIVIFVKPLTADTASIGVAYNRLLPQKAVKDDLRRLLEATGWQYGGDLAISDASVHPDRPKQFPPTTAAMLTVLKAPQVRNGAPELMAYLKAFQHYNHVEVNFALPDLTPYTGVQDYADKALTVELHKDQGVYRYETEIRDHSNPLPDTLQESVRAANVPAEGGAPTEQTHATAPAANHTGALLLFVGVALIAAVYGIYLSGGRRAPKSIPAQSTHRR